MKRFTMQFQLYCFKFRIASALYLIACKIVFSRKCWRWKYNRSKITKFFLHFSESLRDESSTKEGLVAHRYKLIVELACYPRVSFLTISRAIYFLFRRNCIRWAPLVKWKFYDTSIIAGDITSKNLTLIMIGPIDRKFSHFVYCREGTTGA